METVPLPLTPARVGERELRLWRWDGSEIAADAEAEAEASGHSVARLWTGATRGLTPTT